MTWADVNNLFVGGLSVGVGLVAGAALSYLLYSQLKVLIKAYKDMLDK